MRTRSGWGRYSWVLCLLGSMGSLCAQDTGFGAGFKLRMATSNQSKDNLKPSALGFGLNFEYKASFGTLGAEVGYFYKNGDPYLAPIGQLPVGATNNNAAGEFGHGNTLEPIATDGSGANGAVSGDSRRSQLDGLTLRLSYQHKLTESLDWQAGVMLGGTRFKHQWNGSIASQNVDLVEDGDPEPNAWEDQYIGTATEGGMKVSPYLGLSWNITKDSSLEFNVLFLNYTALNYHHIPGTADHGYHLYEWGWQNPATGDPMNDPYGPSSIVNDFSKDTLTKQNRMVPHLEIAYVFHF